VNAVGAFRVAEAGVPEHPEPVEASQSSVGPNSRYFAGTKMTAGVKGAGGFPSRTSWREDRRAGEAMPFAEGLIWLGRESKGGNEQEGR